MGVGVCSVATPFAAACALALVPPPSPLSMSDRRFSSLSELLERALSADFRPEAAARLPPHPVDEQVSCLSVEIFVLEC